MINVSVPERMTPAWSSSHALVWPNTGTLRMFDIGSPLYHHVTDISGLATSSFFVCVFLAKKSPIDHQLAMTVLSSVPSNDSSAVSPRKILLRGWGCHTHTSPLMTLPELQKSKVLSLLWPELRYFSSNKRESWAQHFQQRYDCVIFAILRRPLNHWRW